MATSRRHLGSVRVFFQDSSVISGRWRTAARWKTRYSVWRNVPRRDGWRARGLSALTSSTLLPISAVGSTYLAEACTGWSDH